MKIDVHSREENKLINTYYFKQDSNAIVPTVARKLLKSKQELKEKLNRLDPESNEYKNLDIRYATKKALTNSLYGILANRYFRMYNKAVSETDTFLVRSLLKFIRTKLDKKNLKVIYYDTDSTMISCKENLTDQLNKWIIEFGMDNFGKALNIKFDYQGHYQSLFLLAMCRYVGDLITPKGKIKREVKGVQMKRKDSSLFTKRFQETLINKLLKGDNLDSIKLFINEEISNLKDLDLLEVGTPCKFNKKLEDYKKKEIFFSAVEATGKMNIKGWEKKEIGEKFYWIYSNNEEGVLAFDKKIHKLIDRNLIDWNKVSERNILNICVPIFKGMNWGKELLELCEFYDIMLGSDHRNELLEEYENFEELKKYYSANETKKRKNPKIEII